MLPVDARVSRVARRLGYGEAREDFTKTARSVREAVAKELPPDIDAYRRAFLYLSHHGTATCTEADPHCTVCPLLADCPEGQRRVALNCRFQIADFRLIADCWILICTLKSEI